MSDQPPLDKLTLGDFAARCREAMLPVTSKISYFPAVPMAEDDVKEYIEEPVAALPPGLSATLLPVYVALVPYLEKPNGKEKDQQPAESVSFERPADNLAAAAGRAVDGGEATLFFAIKDRPVADYHYFFYHSLAELAADSMSSDHRNQFYSLLREELRSRVHGEVDQQGWHLKEAIMRRKINLRRETKQFLEYARQAFVDTLTLYLHGLCCDIDVEPGPRQLPSRHLRKRLEMLENLYPPPEGYAVFPEQVSQA